MSIDSRLTKKFLDELTYEVIGAAIEVHKIVGPGLLESIYHKCMKKELCFRGIAFKSELSTNFVYKGIELDTELRCDLLVEQALVVEFKATEFIIPIFEAKVLTYMKLLNVPKGIIINFNAVNIFKEGQKTFVNELFRTLPP
jgi:GxxExxY protein